jgi:hypothetical protein
MKNILITIFCALSCAFTAVSQTGTITGKVIDEITGEDLVGAVVQIEALQIAAASDLFGDYTLNKVPVGVHEITVTYISYQTKKITGIEVKSGEKTTLNIPLSNAAVETNTVEIVEYKATSTEAAVLMEMKEAKGVVSGIGSAQIAKSQDRDASEVARRIPGVTVVDNRFVIVRGLSERYNSVQINNALAPSMESDVKSFSFDIISSGLIDRFLIYKSPSADLPGEFAGGAIKVFTKNFPNKNFEVSFAQQFGYRQGTTGQDFYFSERSTTDWLGKDDGLRSLPSSFPSNVRETSGEERLNVSRSLNNTNGIQSEKAPLDMRSNLYIGKKITKEYGEFGILAAINYSRTRTFFVNETGVFNVYDEILNESDTVSFTHDSTYQTNARVGGLLNIGFRNKKHKIEFKNFATQMGQAEDLLRRGIEQEQGNYVQSNFYGYNQRVITSSQLLGTHELFARKGNLEWTFGFSSAKSSDPDWRRIRYTKPLDLSNPNYQAYIPFSADPNYFGRLFLDMKETTPMFAASYEHKLWMTSKNKQGDEQFLSLKVGVYTENKERTFGVRNIGYKAASFQTFMNQDLAYESIEEILDTANINLTNGLILDEDTKPQDSYTASNKLFASYLMFTLPYRSWNLSAGARLENNQQQLLTKDLQDKEFDIRLDSAIILPSANLSYNFNERNLLRVSYGVTVNRPEFRELAPFAFYDYKRNAIMNGNPDLTFATIQNYDVRWELYPSTTEMFTLGAFYKDFENPIELYFQPGVGSGGTLSFIPGNAPHATSYGVEVDSRIRIGHIASMLTGNEYDPSKGLLNQFTLVANASWIKSNIELSETTSESGIDNNRPMMGQSPYIINGGVFYQNDSIGLSVSAMYNVIGERVVVAGVPGIPEVWEMPRHLLDLTISKKFFDSFEVRFGVQDLLNQSITWIQDANADGKLDRENDQQLQVFKRGTYFNFGIAYQFKKD